MRRRDFIKGMAALPVGVAFGEKLLQDKPTASPKMSATWIDPPGMGGYKNRGPMPHEMPGFKGLGRINYKEYYEYTRKYRRLTK